MDLKITIKTHRREKQLESGVKVGLTKKKNNTSRRTILSSKCKREGKTQAETTSLVVLAALNCATKES